jgi:hypothetical protein
MQFMLQRPNFGSNEQSGPVIQQNNSKWTKPFCGDEVLMQKMKRTEPGDREKF